VSELCSSLLTLLSLHPGMLEKGLGEAARIVPADTPPCSSPCDLEATVDDQEAPVVAKQAAKDAKVDEQAQEALEAPPARDSPDTNECAKDEEQYSEKKKDDGEEEGDAASVTSTASIVDMAAEKVTHIKGHLSGALDYISTLSGRVAPAEEAKEDAVAATGSAESSGPPSRTPSPFAAHASVMVDAVGLPLQIFTGGNLCHPYLSLSYLDSLFQPSIRGYIIGKQIHHHLCYC
jgi:hypothetical protein